jgi:YjbE family integral membrane protein
LTQILNELDWAVLIKIIGVDIMLGVDNAVVIALACSALPQSLRTRAVFLGTAGAVLLRAVLLLFAGFLMNLSYVKLIAGAYLLYLGYKLLMESDEDPEVASPDKIIDAVKTIVVADFMMSLDNVLAVVGAAQSAGQHSHWYAIGGIIFSIPIIVLGAQGIMRLMDRFPVILWLGAGLLGWVGAEMMITDPILETYLARVSLALGDYTHLAYKLAGFVAVIFAVIGVQHLKRGRA